MMARSGKRMLLLGDDCVAILDCIHDLLDPDTPVPVTVDALTGDIVTAVSGHEGPTKRVSINRRVFRVGGKVLAAAAAHEAAEDSARRGEAWGLLVNAASVTSATALGVRLPDHVDWVAEFAQCPHTREF